MNYYIYDGSFPGFLTVIYEVFYSKESPDQIVTGEDFQPNLFANKIKIETDLEKSDCVYESIKNKISTQSLKKIYNTYLSEEEKVELIIYRYLVLGFKIGKKIDRHFSHDIVDELNRISRRVNKEKHLILGLLRFKKLCGDIFYAPFEPDFNILALIAPHFARRLSDQRWIIHDRKRCLATVYNRKEWVLTEMKEPINIQYSEDESYYQQLWQGFFNSIAIENRKNPRLQRQFMPKRYWKYLVEKD